MTTFYPWSYSEIKQFKTAIPIIAIRGWRLLWHGNLMLAYVSTIRFDAFHHIKQDPCVPYILLPFHLILLKLGTKNLNQSAIEKNCCEIICDTQNETVHGKSSLYTHWTVIATRLDYVAH